MTDQSAWDKFSEKLKQYANPGDAKRWFEQHYDLIREMFTWQALLEFVFEPIKASSPILV